MVQATYPFQNDGIRHLANNRRAFLTDDTGTGKSLMSLRACDALAHKRVLIICAPIGRVSWREEVRKWQIMDRPYHEIRKWSDKIPDGPVVVVIATSSLSGWELDLTKRLFKSAEPFDQIIVDEAHQLKNAKSSRTRRVYGHRLDLKTGLVCRFGMDEPEDAPGVWLLTATPTPNNASELYPHLRALFPSKMETVFGRTPTLSMFEDRYCDVRTTTFGRKLGGNNKNTMPELKQQLSGVMYGRSKREVLKDLGEINAMALPVDVPDPLPAHPHDELDGYMAEPMASERAELGDRKVGPCVEWAVSFLNDNPKQKIVIFAHHTAVIDAAATQLGDKGFKGALIDGRTAMSKRGNIVEQFQTNPECRVFIGQILAANTSITLTAASTVLIIEPDWTPANNYQAISRCHRIGQTEPVNAYFAHAAGGMDARITAALVRKAKDAEFLTDKKQEGYVANV